MQERYLLTVSWLHLEKDMDSILQAVKVLREGGSVSFDRCIIVGDGPWRPTLEHGANALGINDLGECTGFVSDEALDDLYRHALLNRAVIGPNHGGPTGIIRDGVTSPHEDPMDSAEIADSIARCFHNPALLERFREQGYHLATSELTIGRPADRCETLLRQGPEAARHVGGRHRAYENRG